MGKVQRAWAKKQRLELRRKLGMKCNQCGSRDYRKLEFDCIEPRGGKHHRMEWSWRISFYRKEFSQGNLQLLCGGTGGCHNKKTYKENYD